MERKAGQKIKKKKTASAQKPNSFGPAEVSFADALPEDKVLFDRTVVWAHLIKRIEQMEKNGPDLSVADLENDYKKFYEICSDESESESMKSGDFESETENDNFDREEALKMTIPAIIQREKYWQQCNSIDKVMDTLSIAKLSELPAKLCGKSVEPREEQYQSTNLNNLNKFNDFDESSIGSIETICYIKKNSKKQIDRNKFNQKIKLNRMRNSKNFNLNYSNDYFNLNSNGSSRDQSNWKNKCDAFLKAFSEQNPDNYSFEEQYIFKQKYTKSRSNKETLDIPIKNVSSSIKHCNLSNEPKLNTEDLFNPDLSFNLSFFEPSLNSTSSEKDNIAKILKKKSVALYPIIEASESSGSIDIGNNFNYLIRPVRIKEEVIDVSDSDEKVQSKESKKKEKVKKPESTNLKETRDKKHEQENENKNYFPAKGEPQIEKKTYAEKQARCKEKRIEIQKEEVNTNTMQETKNKTCKVLNSPSKFTSNKNRKTKNISNEVTFSRAENYSFPGKDKKSLFSFTNKSKKNCQIQTKSTLKDGKESISKEKFQSTSTCSQTKKNETSSEKNSYLLQKSRQKKTNTTLSSEIESTRSNWDSMNIPDHSYKEKNIKSKLIFFENSNPEKLNRKLELQDTDSTINTSSKKCYSKKQNHSTKRKLLCYKNNSNLMETQNSKNSLDETYQNPKLNEHFSSQTFDLTNPINSFLNANVLTPKNLRDNSRLIENNKPYLPLFSIVSGDDSGSEDEISIVLQNKKNCQSFSKAPCN